MELSEISAIKDQIKGLLPEQKVELIRFLADTLSVETRASTPFQFGKYAQTGRPMTTADDFRIAEWHPTDSELNGN
jgi:hypothetical protein